MAMIEPRQFSAARIVAPTLLIAVACVQIVLAHTRQLTPWKGGGFGMFSTADGPSARWLRCYLIVNGRPVSVSVPDEVDTERLRVRSMPSPKRMNEISAGIAALTWVRRDFNSKGEEDECTRARRNARTPYRVWRRGEPRPKPADLIPVAGVHVELWRMRFDLASRRLVSWRAMTASVKGARS